jgi:Rod binding domain-containing protein
MKIEGEIAGYAAGRGRTAGEKLTRSAHEFEAQMMKELLRPMYARDEEGEESSSGGALTYLAGEALGNGISRAGGFGIADRIVSDLSRTETQSGAGSGWERGA